MTKLILQLLLILCLVGCFAEEQQPVLDLCDMSALAEKGDPDAQCVVGFMYHDGIDVKQDYAEAVKWYRKAAEQGNAEAQLSLGLMYHIGNGVKLDIVTAYAWHNIAATPIHSRTPFLRNVRDKAKREKVDLAKKMTPEQISKAQALSKEMVKKNPKLIQKK